MNTVFKHILTIVFLACCLLTVPAYAEITEQYGVRAELTTDQTQYFGADVVKATLTIQNTHDEALTDVNMRIAIPNGFELVGDSKNTSDFGRINSGSSESLTIELKKTPKSAFLPETGDHSSAGFWGMLLAASMTAFVCLAGRSRKGTRMLCLLLSVSLLSSTLVIVPVSAKADSFTNSSVSVTASTQFDGSPLSITGTIQYSMKAAYTRAEWIVKLMNTLGLGEMDQLESAFDDISGESYEKLVESAAIRGFLSTDSRVFRPDSPASREFAASTAIRALGFIMEDPIQCADASEISDKEAIYLAVDIGMMPLIDQHFYPNRILTHAEADQIFKTIDSILATEKFVDTPDQITFRSNVIELASDTPHSDENGQLTLQATDQLRTLAVGDIIVLGDSAYKATEISFQGQQIIISYSQPQLGEFIESAKINGYAEPDYSQIILGEGVTLQNDSQTYKSRITLGPRLPLKIDLGNNWELKFEASVGINDIYYQFDFENSTSDPSKPSSINNSFIRADIVSEISGEISRGLLKGGEEDWKLPLKDRLDKEYLLFKIPAAGVKFVGEYAVGLMFEIYLRIKADGSLELTHSLSGTTGVQFINNHARSLNNLANSTQVELSGEIKAGAEIDLAAQIFKSNLMGVGLFAGVKAGGTTTWHPRDRIFCIDGTYGLFIDLEMKKNAFINKVLGIPETLPLWEYNTWQGHLENLKRVNSCIDDLPERYLAIRVLDGANLDPDYFLNSIRISINRELTMPSDNYGKDVVVMHNSSFEYEKTPIPLREGKYEIIFSDYEGKYKPQTHTVMLSSLPSSQFLTVTMIPY